ncbi:hypothetical protein LWI29_037353 [Acer saccharum]|uniref:RNase H type-1 domain-containing protein n=1 Tax=Acer saccharum TaxID=4024 RepID=A0AA39T612_ACESA|nr:hypothetical protein LWI29_037353 [Acer saccharum]
MPKLLGCYVLLFGEYGFAGIPSFMSLGGGILKDVFDWSEQYLKDFLSACLDKKQNKVLPIYQVREVWSSPRNGVYKANCDAIVDKNRDLTGIGIVIQDSKGEVFASCVQTLEAKLSIKASKIIVIVRSIQFVLDCGLEPCVFETDEATIVKWIKDDSHISSEYGVLLEDISSLSMKLRMVNFSQLEPSFQFSNSAMEGVTKWDPVRLKTSYEIRQMYSNIKHIDQQVSAVSMVVALEADLEQARARIQELDKSLRRIAAPQKRNLSIS